MMTKKRRFVAALILGLALLALVVIVLPGNAAPPGARSSAPVQEFTPCGYDFQITVTPNFPTQTDAINIAYSAMWHSVPTPQHQSHQVMGNVIRLDAIYYEPEVCLPVIWGWGGDVDVGILPTGSYTVQVYLTTVTTMSVVLPPQLCGDRSFRVFDELYKVYLPAVVR
jgi:hypothetical protein